MGSCQTIASVCEEGSSYGSDQDKFRVRVGAGRGIRDCRRRRTAWLRLRVTVRVSPSPAYSDCFDGHFRHLQLSLVRFTIILAIWVK